LIPFQMYNAPRMMNTLPATTCIALGGMNLPTAAPAQVPIAVAVNSAMDAPKKVTKGLPDAAKHNTASCVLSPNSAMKTDEKTFKICENIFLLEP